MLWGKSIFPRFAVDQPMPAVTQPPLFTVGRPKPEAVPADIAAAIDELDDAVNICSHATATVGPRDALVSLVEEARAALDAVILKHLRGEA